MLLQLVKLRQQLKVAVSNYQAAVPHLRKYLLHNITALKKILSRHLQDHPFLTTTPLIHLDPDKRATTTASTNELLLSTDSSTVPSILPPEPNSVP